MGLWRSLTGAPRRSLLPDVTVPAHSLHPDAAHLRELMGQALSAPTSEAVMAFMEFASRLRKLGPYNIYMVFAQRPGAVAVASREEWLAAGQTVRSDAIPILVLRPKGPIAQTLQPSHWTASTTRGEWCCFVWRFYCQKAILVDYLVKYCGALASRGIEMSQPLPLQFATIAKAEGADFDVSIVMPCLNEADSLAFCIANAQSALQAMQALHGLSGEVLIADNGSTDGSQMLARSLGARVVDVTERGYGAALRGGFDQALGRFLVMGDADGSYDFGDSVAMIGELLDGADLCMGSRFQGGIKPGAMPWKNRHIGNPALTGILNLFFRAGIDDAHCGLRAIRREAYQTLGLSGRGMEFASEMVIKASLKGLRIAQVPATLSPDLRGRPPHLRPWRDGWRHLRYLFMLSPTWAFGVPALAMMGAGTLIFAVALLGMLGVIRGPIPFGQSWTIVAAFLFTAGHFSAIMALATHIFGVRQGYRPLRLSLQRLSGALTLEAALIAGGLLVLCALAAFVGIGLWWSSLGFEALPTTVPLLLAAVIGVVGMQTALGGVLIAVIAGNEARFAGDGTVRQ